ncbi:MAG: F0F1 ATP synthase subunit B [Alphaproteobacteria bacterium]|nr:F0F1 ATP synthase subunit B [Alphaproteobacteria bacterium]
MRPLLAPAILALTLFLLPAAARAAGGMPQLDFANPLTTYQVVWGAVIFVILYLLYSRWALPQVADVLQTRETRIEGDLEAARGAKTAADTAIAELVRAGHEAHAGAQAQIAEALAAAKAEAAAQAATLNAKLETEIAAAEQRIGAARTAALGAVQQVAVEAAQAMVTRLVGTGIAPAAVEQAVASTLAARRARSQEA